MPKNPLYRRVLVGATDRRSRFHDQRGNRVPLAGLAYAPRALISTCLRLIIHYRPPVPWISYRARHKLAQLIKPDWTLLEFGSGMSTLWLAQRCASLYSIEHNPEWYQHVRKQLAEKGQSNVNYALRDHSSYADLSSFLPGTFDFVLIDGISRHACALGAVPKVKQGGWIYLDNTDQGAESDEGDYQKAEQVLLHAANDRKGAVQYFTDFAPTSFVANQGMLVHLC